MDQTGLGTLSRQGDRWTLSFTRRLAYPREKVWRAVTEPLTDTFDDRGKAARDAAGWHECLDLLASDLDTTPRPAWGETWRQVHPVYVTEFGPAAATIGPPPVGKTTPPARPSAHRATSAPRAPLTGVRPQPGCPGACR